MLYARSIRDNISYGCDDYGWSAACLDQRVVAAAMQAKAHGFITAMEQGYDTMAGERGGQLSGGQKQRIAIARALVRDPSVLLLDEATSALDTASEAQVQAAIDASMKGRTVVIIAHRLSTVRRADKIVVMSQGQVVEEGTHDELLRMQGAYNKLISKQLEHNTPDHRIAPARTSPRAGSGCAWEQGSTGGYIRRESEQVQEQGAVCNMSAAEFSRRDSACVRDR